MELEIMKNMDAAADHGSTYGQDVEPHGTYVLQRDPGRDLFPGWVGGKAVLRNPLIIDLDDYENVIDYKRDLATKFKAKGKTLTKKLMAKGYDAIITQTKKYGSEEIVLFPNANFVLYQPQEETRKIIKRLVSESLTESIYDDNLERLFHGQHKVRTRIIFNQPNPHGTSYNSEFDEMVNSVSDEIENPTHKERVNLADIAPTQRFISAGNLEKVKDVSKDTNAVLVLHNGIYYAIDGHHRIVTRILKGDSYIIAYVVKI